MKTTITLLALATGIPLLATAQGTGPLLPTAPPADGVYKTLQQVEPRTDLATVAGSANAMHVIDQPGSYYLSGNLDVTTTDGIEIRASGVTLDLMGFTILRSSAAPATGTAIGIDGSGLTNIAIRNGHITGGVTYDSGATGDQFTGPGFGNGIATGAVMSNIRVSHVHVSGCDGAGIVLIDMFSQDRSNIAENCSVKVAASGGIFAGEVHRCTAITCGDSAILALGNVTASSGESVAGGAFARGILAFGNVLGSYGTSTSDHGISTSGNVNNSCGITTAVGADGIFAEKNVTNSYGESDGDDGIDAVGNVSNSYGITRGTGFGNDGIAADSNVTNSYGSSSGGDGISSPFTISYSRGSTSGTGVGLSCAIAVGCTSSGGEAITNKYLMP